jgi:hypothetical protein
MSDIKEWTSLAANEPNLGILESFLAIAKRRKLIYFGHVAHSKGSLANINLQGTVEGTRKTGHWWMSDIKEWTGLTTNELNPVAYDNP